MQPDAGRKRGAVWRRFEIALFETMQAGADSEGFEAMRVGAERHRFGAALFGTTLFGAALFGVMPVWGGGCNPAGRLFSRNSFLLHNLFLSPIIAANLTGEFVCYGKDEQKEKAGTRGEAQIAEACIVRRRHEFCPLSCHQQRRPAEEGV